MTTDSNKSMQHVDAQALRRFIPLAELTSENLIDVSKKAVVEKLSEGRVLFKKGESINVSFYLLSGEVTLADGAGPEEVITSNTPEARYPLDHNDPRRTTAVARTDILFFRIDNDLLDILLTWDQNAGYMVNEIDANKRSDLEATADDHQSDWMSQMLHSSIFHRIPPTNIQAIFMHMEDKSARAGEMLIQQGEEGDYYYHLKSGRAVVTHTTKSGKVIKLAELEAGQGFGEEALISNSRRNANVTMLTDGSLMRLAKEHFEKLLKSPVLRTVDYEKAREMVEGGALFLDVRLDSEHRNANLPNSLNIPLYLLRIKAKSLDFSKTYVVYCDTGRRSSSAAYLLNERGFDALVLDGGLMAVKSDGSA